MILDKPLGILETQFIHEYRNFVRTKINKSKYKELNKVPLPLQMSILDVSSSVSPIAIVIHQPLQRKRKANVQY